MAHTEPPVSIKRKYDELAPLIQQVKAHADQSRHSLGFLPEQVYLEAALQKKMLVAVVEGQAETDYVGHLLFGGTFPHLKVFQIYVKPGYRQRGIATLLIDTLVKEAETLGYLSISARVAEDLNDANLFWKRNGFSVARRSLGGAKTGRVINVRVRELRTPHLFTVLGPAATQDLRLDARLSERRPTFALDLNVMFDLTRRRSNVDSVSRIFNAALNQAIVLRVTEEFVQELRRSSLGGTDPILEFALTLPQFPRVPTDTLKSLIPQLADEVFPERARTRRLSKQDESDLIHLASAIHHKASGFITSEKAILACRDLLLNKYRLEVVGPTDLAESITSAQWLGTRDFRLAYGSGVIASELDESRRGTVEQFVKRLSIPRSSVMDALSPGATGSLRRRFLVSTTSAILGFASWDAPHALRDEVELFIFVDEDHLGAEAILDYLIDQAIMDACVAGPMVVSLRVNPGQELARRAAVAHGFRAPQGLGVSNCEPVRKICVGQAVVAENWSSVRARVQKMARVILPEKMPAYTGESTHFTVGTPDGGSINLSLAELETLMGPTLFLLPSRGGAIVPIRRKFAEELFDASLQGSLLPRQEAALYSERVYYSDPRTLSVLKAGMPIVFYESKRGGGRGIAFACGRIVRAELSSREEVTNDLKRRGVLDDKIMRAMRYTVRVAVVFFDNIMRLRRPVKWEDLCRMHCTDGARLVSARPLPADQLHKILMVSQADE